MILFALSYKYKKYRTELTYLFIFIVLNRNIIRICDFEETYSKNSQVSILWNSMIFIQIFGCSTIIPLISIFYQNFKYNKYGVIITNTNLFISGIIHLSKYDGSKLYMIMVVPYFIIT